MQRPYTELEVWQKCRELVTDIYQFSAFFPKEETFGLTSQIRRSAVSIPSNIAEGCGRNTSKDTLQFLLPVALCMNWKHNFIWHWILNI